MSENNQVEKRKIHVLSHGQFYTACEVLKKHKQQFLDDRPNYREAAERLTKLCGFPVAYSSVADLKEATGVKWESRRSVATGSATRNNALRTITVSLYRLYRKLGEEIPESLAQLYAELAQVKTEEQP